VVRAIGRQVLAQAVGLRIDRALSRPVHPTARHPSGFYRLPEVVSSSLVVRFHGAPGLPIQWRHYFFLTTPKKGITRNPKAQRIIEETHAGRRFPFGYAVQLTDKVTPIPRRGAKS
jgi:hypothetical protein